MLQGGHLPGSNGWSGRDAETLMARVPQTRSHGGGRVSETTDVSDRSRQEQLWSEEYNPVRLCVISRAWSPIHLNSHRRHRTVHAQSDGLNQSIWSFSRSSRDSFSTPMGA